MRFLALGSLALTIALAAGCGDDSTSAAGGGGGSSTSTSDGGGSTTSDGGGSQGSGGAGTGGSMGLGGGLPGGPSSTRLTLRAKGYGGSALGYFEYLPPSYGNGELRPLLLFHHGIGESGDGSVDQVANILNTGLPQLIKNDQWAEEQPFIVLGSQHDAPPFQSCHSTAEIDDFMTFAMAHYDVDPSRVYITGLSCGAIGSWGYLGAHTNERVAAAVLIAGDGHDAYSQAGCALGKVPIWAFHGDADTTVLPSGSVDPINALDACTNPAAVDAKLTLYPGVGHNSWDQTYNLSSGNDIYAWMLGYTKP